MFHPICDACPWTGTPTLDIQDAKRQGFDHWDDHQALFTVAELVLETADSETGDI